MCVCVCVCVCVCNYQHTTIQCSFVTAGILIAYPDDAVVISRVMRQNTPVVQLNWMTPVSSVTPCLL